MWPSSWRFPSASVAAVSGAGGTTRCSTTAMLWLTSTSPAASSIATSRASPNSARCGCPCRTFCCFPSSRYMAGGPTVGRHYSFGSRVPLCVRRHIPPGAPLAQPAGRGPRSRLLRHQSQPALPANHGHDRAALSLRDDLDRRLAGGVARQSRSKTRAAPTACSVLIAAAAHRRHLHPLRRLGHGPDRLDGHRLRPPHAAANSVAAPSGSRALFVVAAPIAWFIYNSAAFGDWLEFMRGPYSAKAIEMRTASHGAGPPHPGWHNPWVSLLFFHKSLRNGCSRRGLGQHAARSQRARHSGPGSSPAAAHSRGRCSSGCPVPFYAYSVSYGSVPIFLPPWWPHSWYNRVTAWNCFPR